MPIHLPSNQSVGEGELRRKRVGLGVLFRFLGVLVSADLSCTFQLLVLIASTSYVRCHVFVGLVATPHYEMGLLMYSNPRIWRNLRNLTSFVSGQGRNSWGVTGLIELRGVNFWPTLYGVCNLWCSLLCCFWANCLEQLTTIYIRNSALPTDILKRHLKLPRLHSLLTTRNDASELETLVFLRYIKWLLILLEWQLQIVYCIN